MCWKSIRYTEFGESASLLNKKTLNVSNFRKKIKLLLLNVLGNEDNYLNANFLIEYFVKLT